MRFYPVIIIALLTACQSAASTPAPASVTPTRTGSIEINAPPEGAVLYSEVIAIRGTVADLPDDAFLLLLTGPDGSTIASAQVRNASTHWQVELPHSYIGEPIEVTIAASPLDPTLPVEYALRTVALAGLSYRPAGAFGSITFPTDGSSVGGESLLIRGTASGVPDNRLSISLIAEDATLLDSQSISIDNPYMIDDVPWSAEVNTNDYTGPARLEAVAGTDLIAAISVSIGTAAG